MLEQQTFENIEYDRKKRMTRREVFLEQMGAAVLWKQWVEIIELNYPPC
jgi:hypothetical protein